ncbi:MAG: pyridoxamine 5'-phosphate oxidase family protein [Akkermansiaceae bacterium]|nr:pyridoxamine 5'-phosphate oxidase family protein [Verrucomicrobiales bacterium]
MSNDQVQKIRELLGGFDTALLVTHGSSFSFHARPMAIARVESNCDMWFFTGRNSAKAREIENDQQVLVVCQDEMSRYVALHAAAKLIIDGNKAAELWKESYKVWFPGGVNDPDLVLIRAQAEHAEYWDNEGFKSVKHLFEAAKAYVRGTRPYVQESEQHASVKLSE